MEELTARVRVFDEQGLILTPGDLQEGAGGRRSTVLQLLDEGNYFVLGSGTSTAANLLWKVDELVIGI